jgi:hypothetical protein
MLVVYDLMPASKAPANDGIIAPDFEQPEWIAHVAGLPGALDVAQRARESAEDDAKTAEEKASRLAQILIALLTISLALGSYQLNFALKRSLPWLVTVLPVGLAIIFLALSAFEALQIDRVGKYSLPDSSELENAQPQEVPSLLLAAEVRGQMLARWSAKKKHGGLMQARAWFTRGLTLLLIAGLTAGIARATSEATSARNQTKPSSPPSTPSAGLNLSGHPRRPSAPEQSARPESAMIMCHVRHLLPVARPDLIRILPRSPRRRRTLASGCRGLGWRSHHEVTARRAAPDAVTASWTIESEGNGSRCT